MSTPLSPSAREQVKLLLAQALALGAADRTAFLDARCSDPAVRAEVDRLLTGHEQAGEFLSRPTLAPEASAAPPDAALEGVGSVIGPYKLLKQIGEGGFGTVFMAEQEQPIRRRVALKILKPGMDTRQVVARFEAERQALAMMDHPNIARVLDAGATAAGRPYFAMELVKGLQIQEYCDTQRLSTRERLALFVDVCHAVQHAHQKGIIHRDLKPSNVLVALQDKRPVPKVIDFGIAKALEQKLTDKTLFTEFRQMMGTPAYMSPEQAEVSGLDVDTRSDIYSLGVLLYELLTGALPFDLARLQQAGYEEILRIIREEEPAKPSTKVSTLAGSSASVAACRRTEPRKLGALLRGDLDWIVMKTLEKERARRYETANALAADVQRFLDDEPVEASAPSRAYRARKFVRRHRVGVLSTAALVLLLGIGVAGTSAGLRKAQIAEASDVAAAKDADRKLGIAREGADILLNALTHDLPKVAGTRDIQMRLLGVAEEHFQNVVKESPGDLDEHRRIRGHFDALGRAHLGLGNVPKARAAFESYLALVEEDRQALPDLPATHMDRAHGCLLSAMAAASDGQDAELGKWLAQAKEALGDEQAIAGYGPRAALIEGTLHEYLGLSGIRQEALAQAKLDLEQARKILEPLSPAPEDGSDLEESRMHVESLLADLALLADKADEAEAHCRSALASATKLLEASPTAPVCVGRLALCEAQLGEVLERRFKDEDATEVFVKARSRLDAALNSGRDNPCLLVPLRRVCQDLCEHALKDNDLNAANELGARMLKAARDLVKLYPDNRQHQAGLAASLACLARLAASNEDKDEEQKNSTELLGLEKSLAPEQPALLQLFAQAYFATGNAAQAVKTQELALKKLDPAPGPRRTEFEEQLAKYQGGAGK